MVLEGFLGLTEKELGIIILLVVFAVGLIAMFIGWWALHHPEKKEEEEQDKGEIEASESDNITDSE